MKRIRLSGDQRADDQDQRIRLSGFVPDSCYSGIHSLIFWYPDRRIGSYEEPKIMKNAFYHNLRTSVFERKEMQRSRNFSPVGIKIKRKRIRGWKDMKL